LNPGSSAINVQFFEGDIVWPEDKKTGTLIVNN
jgi:hypothetical protein